MARLSILTTTSYRRKGLHGPFRLFVSLSCVVMYAMAATHYVLTISAMVSSRKTTQDLQMMSANCVLKALNSGIAPSGCNDTWAACTPLRDRTADLATELSFGNNDCTFGNLLSVNVRRRPIFQRRLTRFIIHCAQIVFSDSIVIGRACMLWPGKRAVRAIAILVIAWTLGQVGRS